MIWLNASLTHRWLRNCHLKVFKYVPVIFQSLMTISSWLENIFGMASVFISVWWLFHSLGMVYFGIYPTGLEDNLQEATVQCGAP